MKIAIVDVLGLPYNGDTLSKTGLGGSESAVISIARELSKIGFAVTVYNNCTDPGVYDNVMYRPYSSPDYAEHYDVLISSRSVSIFAQNKERFKSSLGVLPNFDKWTNDPLVHKVLWTHDTFIDGDNLIEYLVAEGKINEIFTLSDWHTTYIANCDHGKRRNFEVLKNHIFQTRNGINKWTDEVIIANKDPDLFVYNASVTKGMVPLVEKIWPKVKQRIPSAKLMVIGGYYRFADGVPDDQELRWHELVNNNSDITFTGIITQQEISKLLSIASYMIYPCAFPETFGISTLEAIAHNVPIVTCRFGALEETAIDAACYKINYPVEKNWALQWLDEDDQVNRFVDMTVAAYNNRLLHQQKMYAGNQVKDICEWSTVALQWKQHIYYKLGYFMNPNEYRKVKKINHMVRKIFNRRYASPETNVPPKQVEHKIHVIVPAYNAEKYIVNCILSVYQQDYHDYQMTIIDDASTDGTFDLALKVIDTLDNKAHFEVIKNNINVGAVKNQYHAILDSDADIIILLDGDDWLTNDPHIFDSYNNKVIDGVDFSYGSCYSLADKIPLIAQHYPKSVIESKTFKQHLFNWNVPYTHLRVFTRNLFLEIDKKDLMVNGEWPKAGGDIAVFYELLKHAKNIHASPDVVYVYNDLNPANDYKVNAEEQTQTAKKILST